MPSRIDPGAVDASLAARVAGGITGITRFLCAIAAAMAILLPLPVVYAVIMDQLQDPPTWVFETTGYAIIMIAFAASGYGLNTGHHFRVSLLADRIPAWRRGLQRLSGLVEFGFGLVLVIAGTQQVTNAYTQNLTSDTLLAVPQYLPQLAFPIGGAAIALQGIAHILHPHASRLHDVVRR